MKKISKLFFIICILCWIIYFSLGIRAAFVGSYPVSFGWPTNDPSDISKIYGMESFLDTMFALGIAFSVIPVLPISLIYIIVYLIIKKYRKNNANKAE